jgi:hypothetical protein
MHVRGKSFRVEWRDRRDPDRKQVLLDVPHYDFHWQHAYALAEPLPLDDQTRLECLAHFDNSPGNPANPDPHATVRWGDQTWEEMMIAFFEVAVPRVPGSPRLPSAEKPLTDEQQEAAERAADDLFRRFDHDGDGRIRRDEVPDAFRTFGFAQLDRNGDKVITRDEALEAALQSVRRQTGGRGP